MPNETIGQRVRRLRNELKLSQDALSKAAGVSGAHVYQVESGRRTRLQDATARLYADALAPAMPEAAREDPVRYLLFGFEALSSSSDLLPIDVYLRQASNLGEEDIAYIARIVRLLDSEQRELLEREQAGREQNG